MLLIKRGLISNFVFIKFLNSCEDQKNKKGLHQKWNAFFPEFALSLSHKYYYGLQWAIDSTVLNFNLI